MPPDVFTGFPVTRIRDGSVYINGEMIEEPINVEPMITAGLYEDEVLLDEDEFFVLGDNRNDCEDSRYFNFGNVSRDEIIGKAFISLSPFSIISKLNLKPQEEKEETK